ncbi:hypothetical protein ACFYT4_10335 [Streptomyces sp. NPDC004609]|uniref:hypothetical protein n=1 Tax=Streptomyces sp. NPDC004609 TaxID=3364704 RepID=UPI0036A77BDB
MAETVPVRCPSCLRDHLYASPVYPCECGEPLAPPLLATAPPERLLRRTWSEDWVMVRCRHCAREGYWPQPELGCPCGALLRIPVRPVGAPVPARADDRPGAVPKGPAPRGSVPGPVSPGGVLPRPPHPPLPHMGATPRPSFRPIAIRTTRDAVTAAELYLRWLGFREVVQQEVHRPDVRPQTRVSSAVDLRGPGLIAQVEPSTRPAGLRDVECLWLNGLSEPASTVYFALAGYTDDARIRADELGVPLFVMDLTGSPQPVNGPADDLVAKGPAT